MAGRLDKTPDAVVRRLLIDPGLQRDLAHHFDHFLDVNAAHLVMLVGADILAPERARRIQVAAEEIRRAGPAALSIDPTLEDLYFNIEAALTARAGADAGGSLHTARSRNDILATVARMRMRRELTDVCSKLLSLRRTLLDLAAKHVETIMTGHTHLQAAEPITVGHYLSAMLHALRRDYARLYTCLAEVNACPLGSAALASTTFEIDRSVTAELLGFDTVMENSLDGVAARDYVASVLAASAVLATNLSRFAQDLYVWAADEHGYVDVDAAIATTSSVMPQKKNPVTLEHIKSKAAHVQASWTSCLGTLKGVSYSHSRESSVESLRFAWDGIAETSVAVELFEHTVTKVTFDADRMRRRAADNFSCVTELANELVRHHDLPFRLAHHVVGTLVAECLASGRSAADIDEELLDQVAERVLGRPIGASKEMLANALDPLSNVRRRTALGSPGPPEVSRQLTELAGELTRDEKALADFVAGQERAAETLRRQSAALVEGRACA